MYLHVNFTWILYALQLLGPQWYINAINNDIYSRNQKILQESLNIQDFIINTRRELHQIPELLFDLQQTSLYVRSQLDKLKIKYSYPYAQTGIVAHIGQGQPIIALRADMDALPIQEETQLSYQSLYSNKMHACGHDAHTAMLLGAAKILKQRESQLKGEVRLIFQPAEEGGAGSKFMLDEGAFDNVTQVFGMHVYPQLKSGMIGARQGAVKSSAASFRILIHGQGGHAAIPHLSRDPITTSAEIIGSIQQIVSRDTSPVESVVISITSVNGGTAYNVIPDTVELKGTIRTLNQDYAQQSKIRLEDVARSIALASQCTAQIIWEGIDYPVTFNSKEGFNEAMYVADNLVGNQNVEHYISPSLAAEDFAFLLQEISGAYTYLGIRNESAGIVHNQHTSKFQVDETVLYIGTAYHVAMAINFFEE